MRKKSFKRGEERIQESWDGPEGLSERREHASLETDQ
jgi:hypothetical protein